MSQDEGGVYYNDNDKFCGKWVDLLIQEGLLPKGYWDNRSIKEIPFDDLTGFSQCHFFAGIGGWPLALQMAEWPKDRSVWTGSCPCQPFSNAGKRRGTADERHLWPDWLPLIDKHRPATIFGEQVASKAGREWFARVRTDLEALGYAVGAADLCAAGKGSPHIRQRLYWVAHTNQDASGRIARRFSPSQITNTKVASQKGDRFTTVDYTKVEGVGDTADKRLQGEWSEYSPSGERCSGLSGLAMQVNVPEWNGLTIAVKCSDGARRISAQPNSFPLAHGLSNRVGILRGAGNAIVPQVAAEFISAFLDAEQAGFQ